MVSDLTENALAFSEKVHTGESRFHNAWALETELNSVDVYPAFEGPVALENKFILQLLGPLAKGADVRCTDLSPMMVEKAT